MKRKHEADSKCQLGAVAIKTFGLKAESAHICGTILRLGLKEHVPFKVPVL